MCGICGIWKKSDRQIVESMVLAMHHRGPDDEGTFVDEKVSLGMARLAVIDISPAGHQPMAIEDEKIWIIHNGEVYNYIDERSILESKGYVFSSTSDTEVILKMYEEYGDDFLLRLRGMFALAIYDKRRGPGHERLILARDPLGIKPLLWAQIGQYIIFASEIKALLASGLIQPEVDPISLEQLLTFGSIYQPRTILKNVNMLLPAHYLIIEDGNQRLDRYWSLRTDRHPELNHLPYQELVEGLANMLQESVRLHMLSDVPLGAFLSGGIDSSLLVGIMSREVGNRLKTFSVGFENEASASNLDETAEAKRTAEFLGADHFHVYVSGKDVRDHLNRFILGLDQPSVDGLNSYFVSMAARQAVTVAISGTGGDELFAGYPWFAQMVRYEAQQAQSMIARSLWMIIRRLRGHTDFLTTYANRNYIFGESWVTRLLSPTLRSLSESGYDTINDLKLIDELPKAGAVERVSALCLRGYTNNQLLRDIDAVSMIHSLEVRVPFLDIPMVDFALSLPADTKLGKVGITQNIHQLTYKQLGSKKILIDAGHFLGVLQPDIANQPKRGFTLPVDKWLRENLRDIMFEALSIPSMKNRGFFNPQEVIQVRKNFMDGKSHWTLPWILMVIELWAREILD